MKQASKLEIAALILRVLMGAWFVYAGGLKIFVHGLDGFVRDIENYKLISGHLAVAAAYIVPWAEVVAGLCFILGFLKKGSWWAMLGLVVVFTISVGSAWVRGLDITCGCLGGTEKISYWVKAAEFSVYYAVLAFLAFEQWRSRNSS